MRKLGKPLVWSLVGALVGVVISQVAVHTAGLAQAVLLSNEENTISIVRRYASSVVFITAEEMGSGFVLDREGHILTDSHVVGSALQITVQFRDGSTQLAELVSTDARTDLALLQVAELPAGVEPVVLGDTATLEVGQKVVLI
ncbi:MAG: trypsin-like peptidase domain-containing protein, partial [Deinococcus sp.]|nr:trypsin-like peptidase domain-containing protein [Deinococcus sp.]